MKNTMKKLLSFVLFLAMMLSFASPVLSVAAAETKATVGGPDLRVGIISDIHIGTQAQATRFENALNFYKKQSVDAVILTGDVQANNGYAPGKTGLDQAMTIWEKVFSGSDVELILAYGENEQALVQNKYWPNALSRDGEIYRDAYIKEINGYQFVYANSGVEAQAEALVDTAAAEASEKGLPLFYVQHFPLAYTVAGSQANESGLAGRKNLSGHNNVVAITGHTRMPLTQEHTIWQGESWGDGRYTVISGGSLVKDSVSDDAATQFGMVMDVTGSQVTVRRYSFYADAKQVGNAWSWDACDAADRPYTYEARQAQANTPAFAGDAQLTTVVSDTSVSVTVPAASLEKIKNFSDVVTCYTF